MKLSTRVGANRAGAQLSKGPKRTAGKASTSQNAPRHGLAVPVATDPKFADELERLSRMIAGEGANSFHLEHPRRVAEAQIDLLRVRRARSLLLNDARGGARRPSGSGVFCAGDRTRAVLRALDAVNDALARLTCLPMAVAATLNLRTYQDLSDAHSSASSRSPMAVHGPAAAVFGLR